MYVLSVRAPRCACRPPACMQQGATPAAQTIIHVRDAFSPGLLYVMLLSRVTESRLVKIVGPLTPSLFNPVKVPGFMANIHATAGTRLAMLPTTSPVRAARRKRDPVALLGCRHQRQPCNARARAHAIQTIKNYGINGTVEPALRPKRFVPGPSPPVRLGGGP